MLKVSFRVFDFCDKSWWTGRFLAAERYLAIRPNVSILQDCRYVEKLCALPRRMYKGCRDKWYDFLKGTSNTRLIISAELTNQIRDATSDIVFKLSQMKFEDPNESSEQDIQGRLDGLSKEIEETFRRISEWLVWFRSVSYAFVWREERYHKWVKYPWYSYALVNHCDGARAGPVSFEDLGVNSIIACNLE